MDRHLLLYGPAGFVGLLVPVLAVYQFIVLRGSLLQATGRLVVIMGLLWFATSKVEEKTERPPRVGPTESGSAICAVEAWRVNLLVKRPSVVPLSCGLHLV
jgi:hypothetical protein